MSDRDGWIDRLLPRRRLREEDAVRAELAEREEAGRGQCCRRCEVEWWPRVCPACGWEVHSEELEGWRLRHSETEQKTVATCPSCGFKKSLGAFHRRRRYRQGRAKPKA